MVNMYNFNKIIKDYKKFDIVLGIIFIIYIVTPIIRPTRYMALLINNVYGTTAVIVTALSLFLFVNPIIAIIGLLAANEIVRRSKHYDIDNIAKHELIKNIVVQDRKTFDMMAENQFPITLEEEIVAKRTKLVSNNSVMTKSSYKPILETSINTTLVSDL